MLATVAQAAVVTNTSVPIDIALFKMVYERHREGRRATIKALPTHPHPTRPYGSLASVKLEL